MLSGLSTRARGTGLLRAYARRRAIPLLMPKPPGSGMAALIDIMMMRGQRMVSAVSAVSGGSDDDDGNGDVGSGGWETRVGLEVHAQINARTKLLSGASADYAAGEGRPNSQVAPYDMALPGTLPSLNKVCVAMAVRTGLALGGDVHALSAFDRKHYWYPDLPHGFQVTQQAHPVVTGGDLTFPVAVAAGGGGTQSKGKGKGKKKKKGKGKKGAAGDAAATVLKTARVTQLQLEQDSGKLIHRPGAEDGDELLLDLNRAGVGLMEIVFEPDLTSGEEASACVRELQLLLRALGTCNGNFEEGAMRCDVNVSIHHPLSGAETDDEMFDSHRVEVKNLNSLRAIRACVDFEAARLQELLAPALAAAQSGADGDNAGDGAKGKVWDADRGGWVREGKPDLSFAAETRRWDDTRNRTELMRKKDGPTDYRFMREPDLPVLELAPRYVDAARRALPELPAAQRARLAAAPGGGGRGVRAAEANVLAGEPGAAAYFEAVLHAPGDAKRDPQRVANWVCNDLFALLKDADKAENSGGENGGETPQQQVRTGAQFRPGGAAYAQATAWVPRDVTFPNFDDGFHYSALPPFRHPGYHPSHADKDPGRFEKVSPKQWPAPPGGGAMPAGVYPGGLGAFAGTPQAPPPPPEALLRCPIEPARLAEVFDLAATGAVSTRTAKELLSALFSASSARATRSAARDARARQQKWARDARARRAQAKRDERDRERRLARTQLKEQLDVAKARKEAEEEAAKEARRARWGIEGGATFKFADVPTLSTAPELQQPRRWADVQREQRQRHEKLGPVDLTWPPEDENEEGYDDELLEEDALREAEEDELAQERVELEGGGPVAEVARALAARAPLADAVAALGWAQLTDPAAVASLCADAAANPKHAKELARYAKDSAAVAAAQDDESVSAKARKKLEKKRAGALNFFVGRVMAAGRGRVDPGVLHAALPGALDDAVAAMKIDEN